VKLDVSENRAISLKNYENRRNCEGSHNTHGNFSVSISFVGKTGACGKVVSGAMVQGAGRTDRSGLARQNALRLRYGYLKPILSPLEVTNCDLQFLNSVSVNSNIKTNLISTFLQSSLRGSDAAILQSDRKVLLQAFSSHRLLAEKFYLQLHNRQCFFFS